VSWSNDANLYQYYEVYYDSTLLGKFEPQKKSLSFKLNDLGAHTLRLIGIDGFNQRHRLHRVEFKVVEYDFDGDGLSDYLEKNQYRTNVKNHDSDFDGIPDGIEVHQLKSNPMLKDHTLTQLEAFQGDELTILSGNWMVLSDNLTSDQATGLLGLTSDFRSEKGYVLRLYVKKVVTSQCDLDRDFFDYFKISVEDLEIEKSFVASKDQYTAYNFFIPHISNGEHQIKLEWSSYVRGQYISIKKAELFSFESAELQALIENTETLSEPSVTSKISPIDIEGTGAYLDRININNQPVFRGAGESWYQSLSLNPTQITPLQISMGNVMISKEIDWVTTYISSSSANLILRAGDSLKMSAVQNEQEEATIWFGDEQMQQISPAPVIRTFEKAGTVVIKAIIYHKDGVEEANFTVRVVAAPPLNQNLYLIKSKNCNNVIDRIWSWKGLPDEADVESAGLNIAEIDSINGDRSFLIDQSELFQGKVVARIKGTGAILGVADVQSIDVSISTAIRRSMRMQAELDDQTLLLEESYFCHNFPGDLRVEVHFWTSGAFFSDGESKKFFYTGDFTKGFFTTHMYKFLNLEIQNYHFQTSACHAVRVLQGDQEIFRF